MSTQTKTAELTAISSWADVDTAMRLIGELRGAVKALEVDLNRKVAALKEEADTSAQPLHEQIKELEADIKKYVKRHRAELEGKSKSLNFGKTGFRASTSLVIPQSVDIVAELRRHGMEDCIKIQESVIRDMLKAKPEEEIRKTGAYLKVTDTFFCDIHEEKIKATV